MEENRIGKAIIREVIRNLEGSDKVSRERRRWLLSDSLLFLLILLVLLASAAFSAAVRAADNGLKKLSGMKTNAMRRKIVLMRIAKMIVEITTMGKMYDALQKVEREKSGSGRGTLKATPEDIVLDNRLVSFFEPASMAAEQYRRLRTYVIKPGVENSPKTILVTSAMAGEGKSLTAINLAIIIAIELQQQCPDRRLRSSQSIPFSMVWLRRRKKAFPIISSERPNCRIFWSKPQWINSASSPAAHFRTTRLN